jgi:tetratricopeptide (TPR) repeat protein
MATTLKDRLQGILGDTYALERELSPGGMSRLFLATERALDRKVVVKLLPPELASELNAQRFQREMLVTARLQHAHILPVLSAGSREGLLYYVTPYVPGESLRHLMKRAGKRPLDEALRYLREVMDALAFAHRMGVIHRDLKPDNILLQHGHVLLADFGIARALEEATRQLPAARLTSTGMGLGTPGYMAPEQLAGEPNVDARADLYAWGVVAYEMLAGRQPFVGASAAMLFVAQMTKAPEPLTSYAPDAPAPLVELIMRCLEREPSHRWQSAEELRSHLDEMQVVTGGSVLVNTPPESSHPSRMTQSLGGPGLEALRKGLAAFEACDWHAAYEALNEANSAMELAPEHLEHLAEAAWWLGKSEACIRTRERAYTRYLERADLRRAGGVAISLAEDHMHKLAKAVSHGWLQRAERHLRDLPESAEHGWLTRTHTMIAVERERDLEKAHALAKQTMEIARRLGDRNLQALALQDEGRILVEQGRVAEGMALIDEAMTAAVSGQLDPHTTGRTYCNMMSACEKLSDYRRAAEWNQAAMNWCEPHAQSAYPGICRVHRAEVLRLSGAWSEAEAEARRAAEELRDFIDDAAAEAYYEMGEVRLRMGDFAEAERLFRQAHELGRDPLPGLAMLRLAQGQAQSAKALIDRALADPSLSKLQRARLLPALSEVALGVGVVDEAREAAAELESVATAYGAPTLSAHASLALGAVELAEGKTREAVGHLRQAWRLFKESDLPYETARARVLLAKAYHASGNREDAALELRAAASSFERLGAAADMRSTAEMVV